MVIIDTFHVTDLFLHPLKTSKTKGFWCFQGLYKEEQQHEMG